MCGFGKMTFRLGTTAILESKTLKKTYLLLFKQTLKDEPGCTQVL